MKIFSVSVFAVLAALGSAAASELDFTLVNRTGHDIDALYLSASGDRDWNENLLPDGAVIKPGASAAVKFAGRPADAQWDILAVDADGAAATFEKVDLIDAKTVTLSDAGKPTATVE